MIRNKLIITSLFITALFLFVPEANAQPNFNNKSNNILINWSEKTNDSLDLNRTSAASGFSGGLTDDFCENKLFSFQSDNLFVGTFCDLSSLLAVSAADFATNATCTIQKVAMGNYDSSIIFTPPQISSGLASGSASVCQASRDSSPAALKKVSLSDQNIFGVGEVSGLKTSNTGIYLESISQLSQDINPPSSSGTSWIYNGYKLIRNFATVAAFIALMIFAFANILHIDINTYTIKKMIPNMIVAVVGAYLSIYVIYLLSRGVDFLYRLQFFSPYNSLHPFYNIMSGNFGDTVVNNDSGLRSLALVFKLGGQVLGTTGTDLNISIVSGFLGLFFISIPAVIVFAFEYVLALRPLALGLLVVFSPIAFAAYVFPTGQTIFKKWVTITLIALFYTPVVNMVLYIVNSMPVPDSNASVVLFILSILVKSAVFVLLIRLPFTIENDIQKITLALGKTNLGASLGLGKNTPGINVKADNRNTVSDRILASKEAKSLIAPISNAYRRNIAQTKSDQASKRANIAGLRDVVSSKQTLVKNLLEIGEKAHKNNLGRAGNLLLGSISDLSSATLRKVMSSSDKSIFSDSKVVGELKAKNGQLLDDEGAVTRSDAAKKVLRYAQLSDPAGKLSSPAAIKLLAQKQLLSNLPVEVIKKSFEQGVIGKEDLRANFAAEPEKVINYLAQIHPAGQTLDVQGLREKMQEDFYDSRSGFTELLSALNANKTGSSANSSTTNTSRMIETIRTQNQNEFDQNGLYYLSRLNQINNQSKKKLELELKQSGTPVQTAMAIAQNPALSYDQVISYVPKTATPQALSAIRETIAERTESGNLIGQVSTSLKEDKVALGNTVSEKLSESFKSGSRQSFDNIKTDIVGAIKNLHTGSNPDTIKESLGKINSFASGTSVQISGNPTPEDIDKAKEKGEAVLSTIDEMKMAGIDEKTLVENPSAAGEKLSAHTDKIISDVASGKSKPGISQSQAATGQTDVVSATIGKVIATDAKGGSSFEQKLDDISQKTPSPGQTQASSEPQPSGSVNG